ncbi:hypothetical protein HPP92_008179 [Vanilla planifolia]|uniref:Myb/SANT-like domain-containing protein n=1 Tax=Vanilla planifolia TaxID=51239 RepID=A0A835V9F5_VANPL|nr:hypothetical protein HPP92_008179 [Vanilla planifolia]
MRKNKEGGTVAHWDERSTMLFCDLCIEQIETGNKPTTHFNREGWQNIKNKFNATTNKDYEKTQFKNKWDQLKKDWRMWKELKGSEIGMGWDTKRKTVVASNEWWAKKCKVNPALKKFRTSGIPEELECKLSYMFASVATNNQMGCSSNGDVLPLNVIEGHDSSDEVLGESPARVDDLAITAPGTAAPHQHRSSLRKTSKSLAGVDGDASIMRKQEKCLAYITETTSNTASECSQRALQFPTIAQAVKEIDKYVLNDIELWKFSMRYIRNDKNRELWMAINDSRKLLWLEDEYKLSLGQCPHDKHHIGGDGLS